MNCKHFQTKIEIKIVHLFYTVAYLKMWTKRKHGAAFLKSVNRVMIEESVLVMTLSLKDIKQKPYKTITTSPYKDKHWIPRPTLNTKTEQLIPRPTLNTKKGYHSRSRLTPYRNTKTVILIISTFINSFQRYSCQIMLHYLNFVS